MIFGLTAEFRSTISQDPQQWELLLLEEWQHFIINHISSSNGIVTIIQFCHCNFTVSVNEGLLIDAAYSFNIANIISILGPQITRMFGFNFTYGFPFFFFPFQGYHLCLRQDDAILSYPR